MFVLKKKFVALSAEVEALRVELGDAYAVIGMLNAERAAQPSSLNVQLQELWKRRPVFDDIIDAVSDNG